MNETEVRGFFRLILDLSEACGVKSLQGDLILFRGFIGRHPEHTLLVADILADEFESELISL